MYDLDKTERTAAEKAALAKLAKQRQIDACAYLVIADKGELIQAMQVGDSHHTPATCPLQAARRYVLGACKRIRRETPAMTFVEALEDFAMSQAEDKHSSRQTPAATQTLVVQAEQAQASMTLETDFDASIAAHVLAHEDSMARDALEQWLSEQTQDTQARIVLGEMDAVFVHHTYYRKWPFGTSKAEMETLLRRYLVEEGIV